MLCYFDILLQSRQTLVRFFPILLVLCANKVVVNVDPRWCLYLFRLPAPVMMTSVMDWEPSWSDELFCQLVDVSLVFQMSKLGHAFRPTFFFNRINIRKWVDGCVTLVKAHQFTFSRGLCLPHFRHLSWSQVRSCQRWTAIWFSWSDDMATHRTTMDFSEFQAFLTYSKLFWHFADAMTSDFGLCPPVFLAPLPEKAPMSPCMWVHVGCKLTSCRNIICSWWCFNFQSVL